MKHQKHIAALLFLVVLSVPPWGHALEALTPGQMKNAVAQAGVDIAISNAMTEIYSDHITLSSPDQDASTQYMTLNGVHILTAFNTCIRDESGNGTLNHLSLDVGTYASTNQVMLFVESPDLSILSDLSVDSIVVCDQNIGRLDINDFGLSSIHLYAGPHASSSVSGIDFELGLKTSIDTLAYQYGNTSDLSLVLSDVCFASYFDGSTGKGEFQVGDLLNGRPASFDVGSTTTATGYRSYVALNLPMEGSFHIGNITFGGNDFGSFTVDGFSAEKLYIEIPGRGLGK